MADDLPPNWRAATAEDGKEYFFNELTGETSWVKPGPLDEPKAALPLSDPDEGEALPAVTLEVGSIGEAGGAVQPVGADDGGDINVGTFAKSPLAEGLGSANLPKLMVIVIASFVVMLQASIEFKKKKSFLGTSSANFPEGETAYAVAVGTVSIFLVLTLFIIARVKPSLLGSVQVPLPGGRGSLNITQMASLFLGIWWAIGVGILTFHSPYTVTSNAYFCCWAAAFASLLLCHSAFTTVAGAWQRLSMVGGSDTRIQHLAVLSACALALFLASFDHVSTSQGAWAMACGVLSGTCIAIVGFLTFKKKLAPPVPKVIAAVQLLLWINAAGVLTFDDPFKTTSNGYFACWLGLGTAASSAYMEFFSQKIAWTDGLRRSFSIDGGRGGGEMPSAAMRM